MHQKFVSASGLITFWTDPYVTEYKYTRVTQLITSIRMYNIKTMNDIAKDKFNEDCDSYSVVNIIRRQLQSADSLLNNTVL